MSKKIILIVKIMISLILIAPVFLVGYLVFVGAISEEKREVIDTVISEDGAHKAVVTKLGDSYGYDDTIEFALFDCEGRRNAVFVDNIYELNQGEDRYSVEWGAEQVTIMVNTRLDQSNKYRIVVDYDDLAGRDVPIKDALIVLEAILPIAYILFAVSTILLMFSKTRKVLFGFASAVLLLITMFLWLGLNIHNYDLSMNDVIYEYDTDVEHSLTLRNENYELFRDRLNKVHVFYHSSEQENISLSTYASGKIDNTEIDVVFHDPDALTITIQGEDSFEFTLIRESGFSLTRYP